jgi:hypothetical protein
MPDAEDTATDGLTVANNVVHEPEGYKQIHLGSAGSFSTTGGLGASVYTVEACAARPVGSGSDLFCAWIANSTLHVGLNGVTATTAATGYPLTFPSHISAAITAFDVCESYGKIFFIARGSVQAASPSAVTSREMTAYMDY